MANTYKKLQTVTVGAGRSSSIEFTNIPQTYTDLKIVASVRSARSANEDGFAVKVNANTTGYSYRIFSGNGSSASSATTPYEQTWAVRINGNTTTSNTFSNVELYFPNYTSSNSKAYYGDAVTENNATEAYATMSALLQSATGAITDITLSAINSTLMQYSTATLYGVFKASVSGAPSAPTSLSATAGDQSASISFTPAGQTASYYTLTSTPGSYTGTGFASPVTVSGLTNGTAYTFTATATNPFGTSSASSASGSVTPFDPSAGYLVGGNMGYPVYSDYASKLLFSAETVSQVSSVLDAARSNVSGMANSGTAGYIMGGMNSAGTHTNSIRKLLFADESSSTIAATYVAAVYSAAGFANSGTAGYYTGGRDNQSPQTLRNEFKKIAFSNDSGSTLSATAGTASVYASAFANSGTAGYYSGGQIAGYSYTTRIEKLTFSGETRSTLGATLSSARAYSMGFANSGTAGYWAGGSAENGSALTQTAKLTFSNDSLAAISATFSSGRMDGAGVAKSGTAGYCMGGLITDSNTKTTQINKLLFSNDTLSILSATVVASGMAQNAAGVSNSGTL